MFAVASWLLIQKQGVDVSASLAGESRGEWAHLRLFSVLRLRSVP
jgi:hypothetical protein